MRSPPTRPRRGHPGRINRSRSTPIGRWQLSTTPEPGTNALICDAVAHLAGDQSSVELVRDGGRFVSTLVQSPDQVPTQTATVIPVFANPTREVLDQCAQSWPAATPR